MKEFPLIFSAPMIRAFLDGRKTQTRRIIKLPKWAIAGIVRSQPDGGIVVLRRSTGYDAEIAPPARPGDLMWARETWRPNSGAFQSEAFEGEFGIDYRADGKTIWHDIEALDLYPHGDKDVDARKWLPAHKPYDPWRPSIHMPKWASRIRRKVKAVRVERVQDISEEDARAEGTLAWCPADTECLIEDAKDHFRMLWESIHGADAWDRNPWVWVYEFEAEDAKHV